MYVYITRNDPPGNNALRCVTGRWKEERGGGGGRWYLSSRSFLPVAMPRGNNVATPQSIICPRGNLSLPPPPPRCIDTCHVAPIFLRPSIHPSFSSIKNLGEDPDDFSCGRETTYKSYIYIYTIIYDIYDIYIDFKSFKRKIRSKMEISKEREYDNNWPRLCFQIVSVIAYTRESGKFVCLFGRRYREGEREKKFESATKTFGELGIRRAVAKAWPILLAD